MNRILQLFALLVFLVCLANAQVIPPKREFRAVWIASVANLDWPSTRFLSPSSQRAEYTSLLDRLKPLGINAVVMQIRPECDALYQSSIEPWSYWLTGGQGSPPNPLYDPLQFMIDETHKRGMEFHAWFNPFRAVKTVGQYTITATHISKVHPEWLMAYGSLRILDPGLPMVREYVTRVILDVVRRYDIEGVHFDDYFYENGTTNQDSATYANYKNGFNNIGDWRRNNVNTLVGMVYDSIQSVKPYVKFGISPRGIWKNSVANGGAGTNGGQSYYDIFCDPIQWLSVKKVDYVAPQVYWSMSYSIARYDLLAPWWGAHANGRHILIGQAAYRINTTSTGEPTNWLSPSEMPNQIRLNRQYVSIKGSIFFRANQGITDNRLGFTDSLKNNFYKYPALIPTMPWKDSLPPLPPSNLTVIGNLTTATLHWQKPGPAADGDTARYFVVYRAVNDTIDMNDPRTVRFLSLNDTTQFADPISPNVQYNYVVTAFDRLHNESAPTKIGYIVTGVGEGIAALPYEYRLDQNYPNPFNPRTTISFTLQQTGVTTLKVYDLLGREVATLVDGVTSIGNHSISFSGEQLSSGVYFYRVNSGSFVATKKMILQK